VGPDCWKDEYATVDSLGVVKAAGRAAVMVSTASHPPLQARGRGTHSSEREGKVETPKGRSATRPVKAGFFETPFGKYPKIQILTIAELFKGKRPDVPLVDPTQFKKAQKELTETQDDLPF